MVTRATAIAKSAARPFIVMGLAGIVFGGMLSAFLAREPSREAMWMSAFLVLIVGLAQFVLGFLISLVKTQPNATVATTTSALYNLACFAIIGGTIRKEDLHYLVAFGSILLFVSLVAHMQLVRGLPKNAWRSGYYCMMIILLISIVVGNILSYS